ncbi:MAG: ABC transporter permease [Chloroflexi bacterium]|jgi:ribose/xylose/arabinose/galactoside ABC-type transport system permease subunit|nr:ABC transporter permease [Anaerolineaceae bacterium]NMB90400.1 ABC transporter permease [Chloroflexota bacterium]
MEKTAVLVRPVSIGRKAINIFLKYGIYLVFVILCVGVAIASPVFLTVQNLSNVLLQTSTVGIIAVGMTFVIIARGIDVSVGAIVALSSAVAVTAMKVDNQPWWMGLILIFAVALAVGLANGLSSAYLRMPPFLVTLATMTVARGMVLSISQGQNYWGLPDFYPNLGLGTVGPLSIPVVIMLLSFVAGHFLLSNTVFGRKVYAVGGNPDAARVSGINVDRIIMMTFVIVGLFCGLASLVLTARLNSFTPSMGTGFEFSAIAAVVIGGTSLAGGEGNIGGTLIGVLIMGVINNALNLLGVSVYMQDIIRGAIIFLAVMIDALRNRYAQNLD